MHQHNVRLDFGKHPLHTVQYVAGDGSQRLFRTHDVQIVIYMNTKYINYLIQHVPMLASKTYKAVNLFSFL